MIITNKEREILMILFNNDCKHFEILRDAFDDDTIQNMLDKELIEIDYHDYIHLTSTALEYIMYYIA